MSRRQRADIAPTIRGAFIRACKYNETKRGKDLTTLIADSMISDTIGTLKAMASFNPRQNNIDITHKIEIADIIALAQQRQQEQLKDITPQVLDIEDKPQDNNSDGVQSLIDSDDTEGYRPSKVPEGDVPPKA